MFGTARRTSSRMWGSNLIEKPPRRDSGNFSGNNVYFQVRPESNAANVKDFNSIFVMMVDMCVVENGKSHHTSAYYKMNEGDPSLVLRRGQAFNLNLIFSRPYDKDHCNVTLMFYHADTKSPLSGKSTLQVVPVGPKPAKIAPNVWIAEVVSVQDKVMNVKVTSSAKCIIGRWKLDVDTKYKTTNTVYNHPFSLYFLFNAWCPEDDVYIKEDNKKEEYVLSTSGLIFKGSDIDSNPLPWNYAQFDRDVLDCALILLRDVTKTKLQTWSDPVRVSRALSAGCNSNQDRGLLVGNWATKMIGGTSPFAWTGSAPIYQQYASTRKPVKYGQCFVFAGTLTTACRTLGIPARAMTCMDCAHDTQGSLTVDYVFDEDGNPSKSLRSESVWNFHAWAEVWMKRRDIGPEYDGWQVLDATPQEVSEGYHRCGPASVQAVKTGQVQKPYDTQFVFAEVNADVAYWLYSGPNKPLKLIKKETDRIGTKVLTKAVGKWQEEDVTSAYKYPEYSEEERSTVIAAMLRSGNEISRYCLNGEFNDIKFEIVAGPEINLGDSFTVTVKISNKTVHEDIELQCKVKVVAVTYTGEVITLVKQMDKNFTLAKQKDTSIELPIAYKDYSSKLSGSDSFNAICLIRLPKLNYHLYSRKDIRPKLPQITIEFRDPLVMGGAIRGKAWFKSPLGDTIKKGTFIVEGLAVEVKESKSDDIHQGDEAYCLFTLTPQFPGTYLVVAKYMSKMINEISGFVNVQIT